MADFDRVVFHALYGGESSGVIFWIMVGLTIFGTGWTAFALTPFLLAKRSRPFTAFLLAAIVTVSLVVYVVKMFVQRVRPWHAMDLHPYFEPSDFSFPSGHAAGSFTVAVFVTAVAMSKKPRTKRSWGIVAAVVTLATSISISRIYLGAHYPTDVLAGALIGVALGLVSARLYLSRYGGAARGAPSP